MTEAPRAAHLLGNLWHGGDYNYEQWLDSPEILDADFRLMRQAHCSLMSVGIFSWSMLEPHEGDYRFDWLDHLLNRLAENGIAAALATPSAAPPAWLSKRYPETRRVNALGQREPHRQRQNFCLTSPVYREKVQAINRRLAERYADHPALQLWHVSNEYGGETCHCDLCYAAFRDWLQARYGDLETLNRAWWTTFWSHRYSDWDEIEPVDPSNHGLMLDWQRFTSDRVVDFFLQECVPLRELTPTVPVTTNFMQPDVGLDYWRLAPHVDIISWDSYPRWHTGDDGATGAQTAFYHDLHRSYKHGQPFLLLESSPSQVNWQPVSRLKRPGLHKLASLQAVAHGANSVMYFQWRQSRGGDEKFHGAVMSHLNTPETRVFRDVVEVGCALEDLAPVADTRTRAQVAVLYDYENEWAINLARLPRNIGKAYQETCRQHYRPFWAQGVSVDIITEDSDLSPYRLVIAPMLYMVRPGLAERIEAFVQAGGVFVTSYLSGLVDETDLTYLNGGPAALRRVLGLYSEAFDALTDDQQGRLTPLADADGLSDEYSFRHFAELVHPENARVLAQYASEFYAGEPALTQNDYGEGEAYYIAARTDDRFLTDLYTGLVTRLGIPRYEAALPAGVTAQTRTGDGQRYTFLMNFTPTAQTVAVGPGAADALTGQPVEDALALAAYGSAVLIQAVT